MSLLLNKVASIGLRLLPANPARIFLSQRGIRARQIIFRHKIPRYKKDLKNLPELTKLLVKPDNPQHIEDAIGLRRQKLAVYKEYLPEKFNTNLIESLFHPDNDIDRLLRLIDEHLFTMTSFYLATSFEAIDDMMRANLCDPSTVRVSPEFEKLCTRTLYKIRFFEADEILKLVKCLSTLRAPENTLIVQAALQMARHLVNDFNGDELDTLTEALEHIEPAQAELEGKSLLSLLKKVKSFKKENKLLT